MAVRLLSYGHRAYRHGGNVESAQREARDGTGTIRARNSYGFIKQDLYGRVTSLATGLQDLFRQPPTHVFYDSRHLLEKKEH